MIHAAVLMLLFAYPARSQTNNTEIVEIDGVQINIGEMADTEEAVLWKYLAHHKGIDSPEALRKKIRNFLLEKKKLPFDIQRVEVAGMFAHREPDDIYEPMFNERLKLSNFEAARESRGVLLDTWDKIRKVKREVAEALSDTNGNPSERGAEVIGRLKGQRINELFAHSWGTEAVYLGILNGTIIPPKKLVVMGVPENNEEKWLMLAKYTGIEVHVVDFLADKAKKAGSIGVLLSSGLPKDTATLEALWKSKCSDRRGAYCADPAKFKRTKFEYSINIQPPEVREDNIFLRELSKFMSHDRLRYYQYLSNRNLFNQTAEQLDAPQAKIVEAKSQEYLALAMKEARSMIADAKAAAKAAAEADAREREQRRLQEETERFRELGRRLVEASPNAPVAAVPTVPSPPKIVGTTSRFFYQMLPNIRSFAAESCRSYGQAPITEDITRASANITFLGSTDDVEISRLSAGLGQCELRLFLRFVEVIRMGKGPYITQQWVERTTRSFIPPVSPQQDRTTDSSPNTPEKPRKPGCSPENGVWGCPVD